jgi:hypothetical protein
MDKSESKSSERETEIENPVADAIYAGLTEIAAAIRELAKSLKGDEDGEPVRGGNYLDGSRIR